MTDCFALLGEPRRPWIDPEALRQKFLSLSAEFHPDRVHHASDAEKYSAQQRYTDINAAYQCLRDPKERLRHFLELERGTRPPEVQTIPPPLMNLFMDVSAMCREADAFLAEQDKVSSPLLRVPLFERGQQHLQKLSVLTLEIKSRRDQLLAELKAIDAGWAAMKDPDPLARIATLARLEEMYRLFGYYGRWAVQLSERHMRLSCIDAQ
jgi:DnaJ-domain-containing protein 1